MKVNIQKVTELLSDKLSLTDRGILITLLLVKEKDSKLTLAKAKTKINFTRHKEDLIRLHTTGYLEWSGVKTATESLKKKEVSQEIELILNFMSNLYKRKFSPTQERITLLNNLLIKYTENQIKNVISNRYVEWKDEPVMSKHLVPETIFRISKFQKYLEEVEYTKRGISLVEAERIELKVGDEITLEIVETFIDSDTYDFLTYDYDGVKTIGGGRKSCRTGKEIKKLLKLREQSTKDFILIYNQQ